MVPGAEGAVASVGLRGSEMAHILDGIDLSSAKRGKTHDPQPIPPTWGKKKMELWKILSSKSIYIYESVILLNRVSLLSFKSNEDAESRPVYFSAHVWEHAFVGESRALRGTH